MKRITLIKLLLLCTPLLGVACSAKKAVVDHAKSTSSTTQQEDAQALAVKKLTFVQKVSDNQVYAKNIVGSMSFNIQAGDKDITVPGSVHMRKDEVIRLQLFIPLIGSEVGRIEFTPDYVLVIDRIHKEYIKADYSQLDFLKKNGLTFYSLQALFWNQLLIPGAQRVTESDLKKFDVVFNNLSSNLVSFNSGNISYTWNADAATGQINTADVVYSHAAHGTSKLNWQYSNFKSVGVKNFPATQTFTMSSSAVKGGAALQVTLKMNEVKTDDNWEPHTIPSDKYKKVEAEDVFSKILSL